VAARQGSLSLDSRASRSVNSVPKIIQHARTIRSFSQLMMKRLSLVAAREGFQTESDQLYAVLLVRLKGHRSEHPLRSGWQRNVIVVAGTAIVLFAHPEQAHHSIRRHTYRWIKSEVPPHVGKIASRSDRLPSGPTTAYWML